jgi:hypothetical protein
VIDPRQQRAKMNMRCPVASRWSDVFPHAPTTLLKNGVLAAVKLIFRYWVAFLTFDRWWGRYLIRGFGRWVACLLVHVMLQSPPGRQKVDGLGDHAGLPIREREKGGGA